MAKAQIIGTYSFVLLLSVFGAAGAHAACTSPAGVSGQVQWVSADSKIKYCDGTNWKDTTQSTGASCAGTTSGTINYSGGTLRFCNGTTGST